MASGFLPLVRTNVREGLRSLYGAKMRTLLALVGILIGVGSVITMISVGEIARATARAEFETLGTDLVIIQDAAGGGVSGTGRGIATQDAIDLAVEVPSIRATGPRIGLHDTFLFGGRSLGSGPVHGVTASFAAVNRLEVREGRFISDLDRHRYYCVVGADVANAIRRMGAGPVVGKSVTFLGRLFTVVGVLGASTENYSVPFQVEADRSVFIPISTSRRMRPDKGIDVIVARAATDAHHETVVREVRAWLKRRAGQLELEITSATQLIEQMESQMRIMTLLLAATGSVSLIVGGIGVMNIMVVSVIERRKEIGIRRALGARRRDIQNQFLLEAVMLTSAGGILGVFVGMAGTWMICRFTGWTFFLSDFAAISGVGVSSIVGIVFGFQPASQAARVEPVVALLGE